MKIQLTIMTLFLSFWATAQVGIGNTDPKASLDISASNTATPSNTDGLLIPRVDEFPVPDPTAAQDGMMVFVTGAGTPSKGFYYWDNTGASWVNVNNGGDSDWYEEGTTTAPNNINDDIFTQGNVAIGKNTAVYSLDIESTGYRGINTLITGNSNTASYGHYVENSNTGSGVRYASYKTLSGISSGNQYGSYQNIVNNGNGTHYGSYNNLVGSGFGSHYGSYNNLSSSGNNRQYGSYNTVIGSGFGAKYGSYNLIPSSAGGTHYGVYSDVQRSSGYAGYFIGRMSLGNTTSNRYKMPAADGAANYIMQTNGSGQVSFVNPAIIGTDNQNLTGATLSGTSLRINIENGNFTTVNLASLQDGTGTDDQNITGSGLAGTNLTIGIENGTSQTIDLSSLQDGTGTDNQNLTGATLTGTSLQIDIENGSSTTIDLVGLQDGNTQNTLDQAYDEGGAGSGRTISATDGAVTIAGEDGFTVIGTLNSGDAIAVTGAGTRMFFNPRAASFRTGSVNGTQWDNSNIGNYSFASGSNTTASGASSTALGSSTIASGGSSLAMGNTTIASGDGSTAMGNSTTASGLNSFTSGYLSTATANASVAIGLQNNAPSWSEMTVGAFATTYSANSTGSWHANDRIFTVGNGAGLGSRSNALTIYKNGLLNINDEYNMPLTDGTANYIMQTNGSGQVSFVDPATIGDGTGTDNQNLTGATLTGTSLQIDIENGSSTTVDLVGLQDGTGTDNQDLSLTANTLSLTNDATTVDLSGYLDNTDNQNITGSGLAGTNLTIGIENGTSQIIDLSSLQDGTGTDNQTIDTFSFNTGTNILTLEVENDGLAAQTVDLSTLQDGTGTDNQNLTGATLTGTSLQIDIQNGSSTTVDLVGLQDGTGTDDQTIDTFSFDTSTNVLTLEVENDGIAPQGVNLSTLNDADWFEVGTTTAPNNINDDIFTQGNVAIGKTTALFPLDIETNTAGTGINTLISGFTTGSIYGNKIENSNTGNGVHYGSFNSLTGTGTGEQYGAYQSITNTGDENHYGSYNTLYGTGTGEQYGTYQSISNTGSGFHYGTYNTLNGTGTGPQYGSYQFIINEGDENHFGSFNTLTGIGTGDQFGTRQKIDNGGSGDHYGSYNTLSGLGSGDQFGSFQNITNTGGGNHYGSYNTLNGTGTGTKYGSYNSISNLVGGTHYGVYSDARKSTGYAGYFIGRMSLGNGNINRYLMPATDGTANYIMQTNGSGQVNFVDPTTIGSDDQTIDTFSFNTGTNILTLEVENDGIAAQTVDLSTLQDGTGTDNQNLTGATLTGTSLQIDIQNGSSTTVDLAPMLPVAISTFAAAKILMSANQSFTGNSWDKINFDTVSFDLTTNFNTTNTRFNVTTAGIYRINASFHSNATSSSTSSFGVAVYVNGSINKRVQMAHYGNGLIQRDVSTLIDLAASDKIEIYIYHTGAITIDSNGGKTSFEIERIR